MNTPEFNAILESRIDAIRGVLVKKAQEYAQGDNQLHNFDVAARISGITPQRALWGMAQKHLVSVMDLLDDADRRTLLSTPFVEEKIGDLINYLILLEAALKRDCCDKQPVKQEGE